MTTFLSGETTDGLIAKLAGAFASEGWAILAQTSTSLTISGSASKSFIFTVQSPPVVPTNYSIINVPTQATAWYAEEAGRLAGFIGGQWLNILATDGSANSRNFYNLLISKQGLSRFWLACDGESFALTIGDISRNGEAWGCVYGGQLHDLLVPSDSTAWGIGFADCRLRLHEIYKAAHDASTWDFIGKRFPTISLTDATNIASPLVADNLGLPGHKAPMHGLLDFFTTYSEVTTTLNNTSGQQTLLPGGNLTPQSDNLMAMAIYGRANLVTNCAIMMPAFYLEGRANINSYGSPTNTSLAPQLYYRGNLPFVFSGGLAFPPGYIFSDSATGRKFIATGGICKLAMRIA